MSRGARPPGLGRSGLGQSTGPRCEHAVTAARGGLLGAAAASLLLFSAACAAPDPGPGGLGRLARAEEELVAGRPAAAEETLEALVAATQTSPVEHVLERFFAEWSLATLHARAAEGEPFRRERTGAAGRVPALGAGEADPGRRPSPDAHRVACIHHAARAAALAATARRVGADQAHERLPAALAELGVERAERGLALLAATTYARLGFEGEAAKALARAGELRSLPAFLAALEETRLPPDLRPWAAVTLFDQLRSTREEEAYRFAVVALEGEERFGHALPEAEAARLAEWIQHGASVRFVDPKSETPWLPGQTRSPLTGVPQIEYVPVERGDGREHRR